MRASRLVPLVALIIGLCAARLVTESEPADKVYRVGTLTAAWAANHPSVEGLKAGLEAMGFQEGRDVVFEHRFTEGDLKALPAAAASLVAARVDLIFASSENATLAATATTTSLPIVFVNVGDPVAVGVVKAIGHPGGNVTGISNLSTELAPKRLELLKELVPNLRRVWAIYDATDTPEARAATRSASLASTTLGLEFHERPVRTAQELAAVLAAVRPGDAFFVHERATSLDIPAQILKASLPTRAPTVFSSAFWIQYGALLSYGAPYHEVGIQAASLVAKIFRGRRPQDLPVEGANQIRLVINLKTVKALGLTIPQTMLLRADQVIE